MEPALLLNATYEPISIVSWKKAITLLWLGKAEVLENQAFEVCSPSISLTLPSVLRLFRRVRVPRKPVQFSRSNIYRRDSFRCQYCMVRFQTSLLTLDHVLPRSRGGETTWSNIVTSCQPCNRTKGDRTPDEASMPLNTTPKEPKWWPFTAASVDYEDHPEGWKPYLWL